MLGAVLDTAPTGRVSISAVVLFPGDTSMAHTRPIPIFLLPTMLLGMVLAASAPAAEQSPWREIHSTHYTVITDAGEKKGIESRAAL